jgi:hypothetical protein
MFSLRMIGVLAAGILTLLLVLPTQAKPCPPGRRYIVLGSSNYGVVYWSTSWTSAAYYYEPLAPVTNASSDRVVPAAFETITTNRQPQTRPVASLSEQTGNDNFGNSGQ